MNYLIKENLDFLNKNKKSLPKTEKKQKIFSEVKQNINGLLNADELSSMKNFIKFDDSSLDINTKRSATEFNKRNRFIKSNSFKIKEYNYLSKYSGNIGIIIIIYM